MHTVRVLTAVLAIALMTGFTSAAEPASRDAKTHGYLGIMGGPTNPPGKGILVRDVKAGSPAAAAGLKADDVILKFDDQAVKDAAGFAQAVSAKKPGDKVTLRVLRDGKEQTITATLGERPAESAKPAEVERPQPAFLGVRIERLTPEERQRLNVAVESGVVVVSVMPNSPAERAGIRPDDVITGVGNQAVSTPEGLKIAIRKAAPDKEVTIDVVRGKEKMTLHATPMFGHRVRDLQHRLDVLEKRVNELEKEMHH